MVGWLRRLCGGGWSRTGNIAQLSWGLSLAIIHSASADVSADMSEDRF